MPGWLAILLKVIADFLVSLASNWKRDRDLQGKGRAEGAADLNRTISEAADEQAKINAADRGRAADVLERLRRRIDGTGYQ